MTLSIVGQVLRPLPLFPLEKAMMLVLKTILRRHPEVFSRMGKQAGATFVIEPSDLPFFIWLDTSPNSPFLRLSRHHPEDAPSATITGSILSHLKMVLGQQDGDALFFSRDIAISGDTEAVLALRNAVDSLDLNIFNRGANDENTFKA